MEDNNLENLYLEDDYYSDYYSEVYQLENIEFLLEEIVLNQQHKIEILKSSLYIQTATFGMVISLISIIVFLRSVFRSVGN